MRRILLSGIGGDSHSVGLAVLCEALKADGYQVIATGIQTPLADIFESAICVDAVLISSNDGHASYYLSDFERGKAALGAHAPLFYLGGNLVGASLGQTVEKFCKQGFDRVFPKFVDLMTVLELLAADLEQRPHRGMLPPVAHLGKRKASCTIVASAAPTYCLAEDDLMAERQNVLQMWSTGREASDLSQNAERLQGAPSLAQRQVYATATNEYPLLHPRSGVATICEQRKLFQTFERSGAQILSFQIDSLTRLNAYADVETAVCESKERGHSTLNGFPLVNHGAEASASIVQAVQVPIQVRHSTRDPRLLAELSFASGSTGFEGGALCYNLPYYKDYPVRDALAAWAYVDTLTGLYAERYGIVLDREFFGTLTATLIPPSLAIVVNVLELLLAASCGVRSCSLGYAEQGNRSQDIAAIRVLRALGDHYLNRFGYNGVTLHTVFHQYMAGFPNDLTRSRELIFESAVTAACAGATRLMVKSPVESFKIPSMSENVEALSLCRSGFERSVVEQNLLDREAIRQEEILITAEATVILDAIIGLSSELSSAIALACESGILDIPFSPSIHCRGEVITARDQAGAVRYAQAGRIPLPTWIKSLHRDLLRERAMAKGYCLTDDLARIVEFDVLQIPRCQYVRWPLDCSGASAMTCRSREESIVADERLAT